ncbi:MAG: hypothetical protein D6730_24005 [Bacteroidetes bacterium]|nr:MAG: hypothetical protein D6730_24005 [Bacteroidota bacterium]
MRLSPSLKGRRILGPGLRGFAGNSNLAAPLPAASFLVRLHPLPPKQQPEPPKRHTAPQFAANLGLQAECREKVAIGRKNVIFSILYLYLWLLFDKAFKVKQ